MEMNDMTQQQISKIRTEDLFGKPLAMFTVQVPQPLSPVGCAVLTYYVQRGSTAGQEQDALYKAVKDYVRFGTLQSTLYALATIYDADGEPQQQWKAEYDDEKKAWGEWR